MRSLLLHIVVFPSLMFLGCDRGPSKLEHPVEATAASARKSGQTTPDALISPRDSGPDSAGRVARPGPQDTAPSTLEPNNPSNLDCEALIEKVKQDIGGLTDSCKTDDDCRYYGFGCPFGCTMTASVRAEANATRIEDLAQMYRDKCGHCAYRCVISGTQGCLDGSCTIVSR